MQMNAHGLSQRSRFLRLFAIAKDIRIDALSRAYVTDASLGCTATLYMTTRRRKMFPMALQGTQSRDADSLFFATITGNDLLF